MTGEENQESSVVVMLDNEESELVFYVNKELIHDAEGRMEESLRNVVNEDVIN